MKILTNFRLKSLVRNIFLFIITVSGFILFQAQISQYIDNPEIDRWWVTTDVFQNHPQPQPLIVVTDALGYDNFNMGVDNAEVSIANNPRNPLWFFTGWNGNPLGIAGTHHTEDGYDPWAVNNPTYTTAGDPWTMYDSLGNLYYHNMGPGGSNTWVSKSTNNGLTWGPQVAACTGNDRNTLCADQTAGPYSNYVYTGETGSGGATFFRSTNLGTSFQSMTVLSPHNLPGVMIAVGPNGAIQGGSVYAVTYSGSNAAGTYNFHRSTNGGTSFSLMSSISGIGIIGTEISGRSTINAIRTRPYPMIAADNSYGPYRGRFYVVYANNPGGTNGLKPDIWLRYSTDFGVTFSSPIQVNDNSNPTLSDQWFPAIWCEKTTGYLYIKWYGDEENPATFQTSVYATHSTDGGVTFLPSQKVSNQSFPYPNTGPCSGCVTNYRGDYDGIVSNGKASMSAWFDGRVANVWGSYTGYYPDFALKVNPATLSVTNINDSAFAFISIPSVKNYTDVAKFSATVTPVPTNGTLTLTMVNKTTSVPRDSLNSYPDSLRLRVKATGGVTIGSYTIKVKVNGSNGIPVHYRTIALNIGLVGISGNNEIAPDNYHLYQNYPNPFNPVTTINFALPKSTFVTLKVYDILGKQVAELVNGTLKAGKFSVDFKGENLSSGVYIYKLESSEFTSTKSMILTK